MNLKDALKEEFKGYAKELLGKVKQKGLELLEDEVKSGLDKLGNAVQKSEGSTDDLYLFVKDKLKEIADKIDGKDDE